MPRDIPPAFISALAQKEIYPFFAVDLNFKSGSVYLWSGFGDLVRTETGKTYLGAGQLLNIASVSETTEIEARGATLSLSGIPSNLLSLALSEPYQGRECKIYLGLLTQPNFLVAEDLGVLLTQDFDSLITETGSQGFIEIFSGELDQMNISESAETAIISVTAENILIKLDRPATRRFSDEDQRSRYPTDKGFEFVVGLQDKEIFWGKATP
jgi:hypothetical protein